MSKVITTSGLRAAILDSTKMQVVFRCRSSFSYVGEPAYVVLAFGIAFLSSIRTKLLLLPVYRPPCWTQAVVIKASRVALQFLALVVPDSIIITFEIFFRPKYGPRCGNFSFTAAILNFRLNGMSNNVGVGTIEKFDPKTWGSRCNFVSICSRTRDIPGGKFYPPLDSQRKYFILDIRRVKLTKVV
jgi:hypothetical protein